MENWVENLILKNKPEGLSAEQLKQIHEAFSGLATLLGADYVEKKLVICNQVIEDIPYEVYRGESGLMQLLNTWNDIKLIKDIKGFDRLQSKLTKNQNVDFEISIAGSLCRHGAKVELEPCSPNSKNNQSSCDARFTLDDGKNWIYTEASRRKVSTNFIKQKNELAIEAANAAKRINPNMFGTIILLEWTNYDKIISWLKEMHSVSDEDLNCNFDESAFFFLSPPGAYDPTRALELISHKSHYNCTQNFDLKKESYGVAYTYVPDINGAASIFNNKIKKQQLGNKNQAIFIFDVPGAADVFTDWPNQIKSEIFCKEQPIENKNISAIILLKSFNGSKIGSLPSREVITILNEYALMPLSVSKDVLNNIFGAP